MNTFFFAARHFLFCFLLILVCSNGTAMASYPQFECTLNWMDGFFFLIMFTGLEWTSLGLPRWAACTLQSFIPFCFLYDSPSYFLLFCYVVILILLCSFELHQKKGWHWISVHWRWWPCWRRQLVSLSSMSTRIYAKDQRYVYTHFKPPLLAGQSL